MAYEFSWQEHYKLQPQKSVVIEMEDRKAYHNKSSIELQLNDSILPNVDKAVHLDIQRFKTDKETIKNTVNNNIAKARRTSYSLMSAEFYGNNGLHPSTCIYIFKTYIIQTLIYWLEIIVPDKKQYGKTGEISQTNDQANSISPTKHSRCCTIYNIWTDS